MGNANAAPREAQAGGGLAGAGNCLAPVIGRIPHRLALAGGWIDQPFVSTLNPGGPGSMVVVSLQPDVWLMDRCGMASGTRKVARRIWGDELPARPPADLVRELYRAENEGKDEPSGSQDMIGLIYPGISRLDYDPAVEGGYFPAHIESACDAETARWLERVLHVIAIDPRPEGYSPLGVKNLTREMAALLGQSGMDCYQAIVTRDLAGLGASMNDCMVAWEALMPHIVDHPTLRFDLRAILRCYQGRYAGAMYSGCGGGYLFVASEEPVPGAFHISVRLR